MELSVPTIQMNFTPRETEVQSVLLKTLTDMIRFHAQDPLIMEEIRRELIFLQMEVEGQLARIAYSDCGEAI